MSPTTMSVKHAEDILLDSSKQDPVACIPYLAVCALTSSRINIFTDDIWTPYLWYLAPARP